MNFNMKKISTFAIILLTMLSVTGFGQIMKASIGPGSLPNRVKIYLMPDIVVSGATWSTLQFNIGIDTTGLKIAPVLTVISTAFPTAPPSARIAEEGAVPDVAPLGS